MKVKQYHDFWFEERAGRGGQLAQGPITLLPGFAGNLAAEQTSLQDKVKDFTIYPVVHFTIGWRF